MPKFKDKNPLKWIRENWDFKYFDSVKKPKEEMKEEIKDSWSTYFGSDGTCLEHDIISCRECRVPATGRCYSSFEE